MTQADLLSSPEKEELKALNIPSCEDADGQKALRRSEPTASLTPAHGRRWGGNRVVGRRAEARSRAELQGTWVNSKPISVHCAMIQRLTQIGLESQTRSV